MKIDFEFQTEHGTFCDCIVLPNNHGMSESEINAMKQKRYADWITVITAAPEESVEGEE